MRTSSAMPRRVPRSSRKTNSILGSGPPAMRVRKSSTRRFLTEMPQVVVMLPAAIKVCHDMRRGILKYMRTHGP